MSCPNMGSTADKALGLGSIPKGPHCSCHQCPRSLGPEAPPLCGYPSQAHMPARSLYFGPPSWHLTAGPTTLLGNQPLEILLKAVVNVPGGNVHVQPMQRPEGQRPICGSGAQNTGPKGLPVTPARLPTRPHPRLVFWFLAAKFSSIPISCTSPLPHAVPTQSALPLLMPSCPAAGPPGAWV